MDLVWKPYRNGSAYEVCSTGDIRNMETQELLLDVMPGMVEMVLGAFGTTLRKRDTIIAETFHTRPAGKVYLNHIDGDENNCNADNLEWIVQSSKAKPVVQYDPNGDLVRTYGSISDAAHRTGASYQGILYSCTGRQKSAGGYYWKYKGENNSTNQPIKPCPFCGGTAKLTRDDPGYDYPVQFYVRCQKCKTRTGSFSNENDAIRVWNARV